MNRTKWILAVVTLLLIGSAAGVLARYKSIQRLGEPGVKTRPIPGSPNLVVVLPDQIPGFSAELRAQPEIVTNVLPKDTSFGLCRYTAPDGFYTDANVVLMGVDRASLHKPDFCLTGAGWTIHKTEVQTIPIAQPTPYDLPVIRITASGTFTQEGRQMTVGGIYVYWFVADNALSASPRGWDRMWSIAHGLLTEGVLQRWAYISYFAPCQLGQEDATYERVKNLIAATVPEFQIPQGPTAVAAAKKF